MAYKVVPFNANLKQNDTADVAAKQLQSLIDAQAANGYEFVCLDNIETAVAPTSGCLGFGAQAGYSTSVSIAVFKN